MGNCVCCEENDGTELPTSTALLSTESASSRVPTSPLQPSQLCVDRDKVFPIHVIPTSEASQLRRMVKFVVPTKYHKYFFG
jgi:hypothetical protein